MTSGRIADQPSSGLFRAALVLVTAYVLPWLAAASVVLVPAVAGTQDTQAKADNIVIDPFTYLQASYTPSATIANPHTLWGKIAGLDGIDNGDKVIAVWTNGKAAIYSADMTSELSILDFGITATGISEVPASLYGFGAKYAVSDAGSIFFYDAIGTLKGGKNIIGNTIRDITYDSQNDRMIVSTVTGTKALNPDGTLTLLIGSSPFGAEYINLGKDNNGNPIDDMIQLNSAFYREDSAGNIIAGPFSTNLGLGGVEGAGYTTTNAIMGVQNGFYVYSKLAFQDHMNYNVPEPASLALLATGSFLLALSKRRFKHQNGILKPVDEKIVV